MTREEAKQLLPIITAFANGEEIEFLVSDNKWSRVSSSPLFSLDPQDYRIKPKLKRVPLEASDVPPGSIVRHWAMKPNLWAEVLRIYHNSMVVFSEENGFEAIPFDDAGCWEIKRPNEDWNPCWKEIQETP